MLSFESYSVGSVCLAGQPTNCAECANLDWWGSCVSIHSVRMKKTWHYVSFWCTCNRTNSINPMSLYGMEKKSNNKYLAASAIYFGHVPRSLVQANLV